jgi:hypothetical protein
MDIATLTGAFAQAPSIVGGKVKVWLIFNRANGVYWGFAQYDDDHAFDEDYFVLVEAEMDATYEGVVGTYPDYKIMAKADMPQEIDEAMLNAMTSANIEARYPVTKQINNLSAVVLLLAQTAGLQDNELVMALQEQVDEIADILRNNSLRKQGYAGNDAFKYVTTDERARAENSKYEGGLHELMGPRTVVS